MSNLLRLSEEKEDFSAAIKEWEHTGGIIDHHTPKEICELCEHEDLRYQFEIKNKLENVLWVGSKCIEKFDIKVYDKNGIEIQTKKETYLLKQAKRKHIQDIFSLLIKTKPSGKIGDYHKIELDEYCKCQCLVNDTSNARVLNYVFLRLDEENIFYEKRFFSIKIRSAEDKLKLLSLNEVQFERIKPALSSAQIKYYSENKK